MDVISSDAIRARGCCSIRARSFRGQLVGVGNFYVLYIIS